MLLTDSTQHADNMFSHVKVNLFTRIDVFFPLYYHFFKTLTNINSTTLGADVRLVAKSLASVALNLSLRGIWIQRWLWFIQE